MLVDEPVLNVTSDVLTVIWIGILVGREDWLLVLVTDRQRFGWHIRIWNFTLNIWIGERHVEEVVSVSNVNFVDGSCSLKDHPKGEGHGKPIDNVVSSSDNLSGVL
jgi:hypothetical protein